MVKKIAVGMPEDCDWSLAEHVSSIVEEQMEESRIQMDLKIENQKLTWQRDLALTAFAAALISLILICLVLKLSVKI